MALSTKLMDDVGDRVQSVAIVGAAGESIGVENNPVLIDPLSMGEQLEKVVEELRTMNAHLEIITGEVL